jgi:hypothetical protein
LLLGLTERGQNRRKRSKATSPQGRAAAKLAEYVAALNKMKLDPESYRQMRHTLAIESKRELAYADIESNTKPSRKREIQKMAATIDVLAEAGRITRADADDLRRYYGARSNLTAADVRKDRNWLWRQNAGEDLAWFRSSAPITVTVEP